MPQLLARDPELIKARCNAGDYQQSTQRLITFVDEIGAASLLLLDREGRVVAATDRNRLGENQRQRRSSSTRCAGQRTVFTSWRRETGAYAFVYSRKIEGDGSILGVIAVEVDLAKLERSWAGELGRGGRDRQLGPDHPVDRTALARAAPRRRRWRSPTPPRRSSGRSAPPSDWTALPIDAYFRGEAVMRREVRGAVPGLDDGQLHRPTPRCASG